MREHPAYAEIENERGLMFNQIRLSQIDCFENTGRYQQCLISPDMILDGNVLVRFDRLRKPRHEQRDWTGVIDVQSNVRCQYYCHQYSGPRGHGFIIGAKVFWEGKTWVYEEHSGPEKLNEKNFDTWLEIVEDNINNVDLLN